jgi:cytochrome c oxidase cbb3-type subunit I/II
MCTVEGGWWLLWMWNAFLILGSASLLLGYIIGVENAGFEWPLNLLHYLVFLGLWYTPAAAIWTLLNLSSGISFSPTDLDGHLWWLS